MNAGESLLGDGANDSRHGQERVTMSVRVKVAVVVAVVSFIVSFAASPFAIYRGSLGYLILAGGFGLGPLVGLLLARRLLAEARECSYAAVAVSTLASFLAFLGMAVFLDRVVKLQKVIGNDAVEALVVLALWLVALFLGALLATYWNRANRATTSSCGHPSSAGRSYVECRYGCRPFGA